MKKLVFTLLLMIVAEGLFAQKVIPQENDSTFYTDFRDGEEWAYSFKNGIAVGITNNKEKDDYGRYYQLKILVENMNDSSFTFDPDSVYAYFLDSDYSHSNNAEVYTWQEYERKVKRNQAWSMALTGIAAGISAGTAAYQTNYTTTTVGGYTYMSTTTSYNPGLANAINLSNTATLINMEHIMKSDIKIRQEGYLKKTTIYGGEGICGYMNVKRKKCKNFLVSIIVNGEEFKFYWSME